jgi:hypothetical protein
MKNEVLFHRSCNVECQRYVNWNPCDKKGRVLLTFAAAFAWEMFVTDFISEGTVSNLGEKISCYVWCQFGFSQFLYESSGRVS